MKKLKAYTLMEVLIVMSIMIILLGVGFNAYASFTENTKFNQDVANLQNDILITQRAAMLLQRDETENWIYGIGIDLYGLVGDDETTRTGEYSYFKWCSEFTNFGSPKTKSEYPGYDPDSEEPGNGQLPLPFTSGDTCPYQEGIDDSLVHLSGYSKGVLNLREDVSTSSNIEYILFEAVSGRVFFYASDGTRIDGTNLEILFQKNYGLNKILEVKNLTGRIKIKEVE